MRTTSKLIILLITFTLSAFASAHAQDTPEPAESLIPVVPEETVEEVLHPALNHYFELHGFIRDGEVHVTLDGVQVLYSENFAEHSPAEQEHYLKFLQYKMGYCGKKGLAAVQLAVQASLGVDTVEDQLANLREIAKEQGIPENKIMGSFRIVNEAYRHGFNDPVKFAQDKIKECLIEGE